MIDIDTINQLNKEERRYLDWVTAKKNKIMAMVPGKRKQAAWRALFPVVDKEPFWGDGSVW